VEKVIIPPLNNGDRLTLLEFERRYEAYPDIKKAELIEGVVYILSSPIRVERHSEFHIWVVGWLFDYMITTPGVKIGEYGIIHFDSDNRAQPDAFLRIEEKLGGKSRLVDEEYFEGAPELIVEVAATTASYNLHDKLSVYTSHGVQELLVFIAHEREVRWHVLRDGRYELLAANERGILRSEVFPGLWLQPEHFWKGDGAALLAVLQEGLASPEHADFVNRLQQAITP
jgi:Uma2 family endonuclease